MREQKTKSPDSALKTIVQKQKKKLEQQQQQQQEQIQLKEQPQPQPRPRQEGPPAQEDRGKSDLEHAASTNERSDTVLPDTCPSSSGKKTAKGIIIKADQVVSSSATTTAAAVKNEPSDAGLARTYPTSGKNSGKDIIKADQVSSSAAAAPAKNDRSDAVLPDTCPSSSGKKTVKDTIKADQVSSSATSTVSAEPSDDVLPDTCPSDDVLPDTCPSGSGKKAIQDSIEADQVVSSLASTTAAAGLAHTCPSSNGKKTATGIIKADQVASAGLAHPCSGKKIVKDIIKADQVVSSSVRATAATATTTTSSLMSEEQRASPTLLERENGQPAAANQEYEREHPPSEQECGNKQPAASIQHTSANSSTFHLLRRVAAVAENANSDADKLKEIKAMLQAEMRAQTPGRLLQRPPSDSHQLATATAAAASTTSSHVSHVTKSSPPPMVLSASEQPVSSELTPTSGQKRASDSNNTESIPSKKQMPQPATDTAVSKSNEEWPLDWHDLPGGNSDDDDFSFTNLDEEEFLLAIERNIEQGSALQRSQSQTGGTIARPVVMPAKTTSAKSSACLPSSTKSANSSIGAATRQLQSTGASLHQPKFRGSKKTYVFPRRSNRETAWVDDMYKWMRTVEHGSNNKTCTETNARSVRNRVLDLAQGKGVGYKGWGGKVFKKGVKVDLSSDIVTMQREARAFEDRHGEDLGHGWVIRHPLKKLELYKEYKKGRGGR